MEKYYKNKTKKNNIKLMVLIGIFFILLILVLFELYRSKYCLEITNYSISADLDKSIRIVQLTDLHNSTFGEDNVKLVEAVINANPDVILITGDLVDSHHSTSTDVAVSLINQLSTIAPIYVSYGNQEKELEVSEGVDFTKLYSNAGATVLEKDYIDTVINGQTIRMGGIYGYCQTIVYSEETNMQEDSEFLLKFQDASKLKILLCHMPVCWIESSSLYDWDVDIVFSGHVHGGQVRLPFVGGLWAPDQGWFPGDECGVYITTEAGWTQRRGEVLKYCKEMGYDISYYEEHPTYKESRLVLSRGLGNTDWLPRFNNVPEIVVVDLVPEQ